MPWLVDIIESERGWGQRVDNTKIFTHKDDADAFVKKYNSSNNEKIVPDWYMYAKQPRWER